jgi:MoaA/NifB/PqqE/SkfB family radical SAM enzyme
VAPALLFIQHAAADDFNPILKFGTDYINDVETPEGDHFVQLLNDKVNEIFDSRRPFTPTTDDSRCQYCPYAHICGL